MALGPQVDDTFGQIGYRGAVEGASFFQCDNGACGLPRLVPEAIPTLGSSNLGFDRKHACLSQRWLAARPTAGSEEGRQCRRLEGRKILPQFSPISLLCPEIGRAHAAQSHARTRAFAKVTRHYQSLPSSPLCKQVLRHTAVGSNTCLQN